MIRLSNYKKLSSLGEFGLIDKIRASQPALRKGIMMGIGDDAAVFKPGSDKVLVVTTDLLVEGIHFSQKWASWQEIGEKALAVNLSDLAAMGSVQPLGYLVGLSLPVDTLVHNVDNLYQGMGKIAHQYRCSLCGGDTVASHNTIEISITLWGEANQNELVYRGGAKPVDNVFVSGPLGGAAAGLVALQKGLRRSKKTKNIVQNHLLPQPQLVLAAQLAQHKLLHSLIDCSDGLDRSLKFIAQESGVGAEILLDKIPLSPETIYWANRWGINPYQWALYGGEDYQLIFTAAAVHTDRILSLSPGIALIGQTTKGSKIHYLGQKGKKVTIAGRGYDHFAVRLRQE